MRIDKHLIGQSYCSVHGRYRQRYLRLRDEISNRGHVFRDGGEWRFSNVLWKRGRKHLICQKVIVPYMTLPTTVLVYYESYRDEIVQQSETASFDKI